jgi:hypothetical protein
MAPVPHLIAWFFGGALLVNALPHLLCGLAGRRFPTPFASPPGKGLSPALVNVAWAFANLALAWFLLCRIGAFDLRAPADIATPAAGMLLLGLMLAHHFGAQNDGNGPKSA